MSNEQNMNCPHCGSATNWIDIKEVKPAVNKTLLFYVKCEGQIVLEDDSLGDIIITYQAVTGRISDRGELRIDFDEWDFYTIDDVTHWAEITPVNDKHNFS